MRFQPPFLPERMLRKNNFQYSVDTLVETSLSGSFSADDIAAYKKAWGQKGALSGMLNWVLRDRAEDVNRLMIDFLTE